MVNIDKINDILSYFIENVPNLTLTKIMKLFYYVDFVSFAEKETSVTNDTYYKLPYGPIPSFIKNEINTIIFNNTQDVEKAESQLSKTFTVEQKMIGRYKGFIIKKTTTKSTLKNLSEYETDLIKRIVNRYGRYTAGQLTTASHKEQPYRLTSKNSIIDYNLSKLLDLKSI